jgi:cytochrome b
MWDLAAKIFGWLLAVAVVLTVLFIMFFTAMGGAWGFIISIFVAVVYILPFLMVLGIAYGVSAYMRPSKLVEVGDEIVEEQVTPEL